MMTGQGADGSLPAKASDLVARKIAGEYILVPVRGDLADLSRIFALSPVAQHVWEQLDRVASFDELLQSVVERFEVGEQEAAGDLRDFLAQLERAGLVRG